MNCEKATELLPWYLNGTLDESERREVRGHLAGCEGCRQALEDTRLAWTIYDQHIPSEALVALAWGESPEGYDSEVLDRASQECRELWRMLVLGLSYREMSLRLQVAEGTLRVRVLRCRERAVASRAELLGSKTAPARNKVVARTPKKGGEATTP